MKKKSHEATRKILFIGPNADLALFTALQREGYKTVACESPQQAAARIGEFRPHLIVVHLSHSSGSGMSTLRECRLMAERVPIVVTTSVPGHETVMRALEEGATSFLSLPLERTKVKKVMDDLLADYRK